MLVVFLVRRNLNQALGSVEWSCSISDELPFSKASSIASSLRSKVYGLPLFVSFCFFCVQLNQRFILSCLYEQHTAYYIYIIHYNYIIYIYNMYLYRLYRHHIHQVNMPNLHLLCCGPWPIPDQDRASDESLPRHGSQGDRRGGCHGLCGLAVYCRLGG